jgi:two-component system, OmpR family, sensor histidine kinase QseC
VSLSADTEQQSQLVFERQTYAALARESPFWSVRVAQTRLESGWIVRGLNTDLLPYLLVTFPFVFIPTWIAVRHGLRPLNRLSAILAACPIDDLSPIAFAVRHEEIKPVVTALDHLLERLRATLARERTFLHDAAHELRTPLAAVSAQAHALVGTHGDGTKEAAMRLQMALDRAARIIQQLLDIARLDNLDPMPRVRIDIANRLREILAEMASAATARQMELVFEGPDHLEVTTEVGALESIVTNLVDNATRYGSKGGTIVVELQATSHDWTLSVCDDGPGIAPEARAHMFERFARGVHQDIPGTGLGLAIVRQAARRLDTDIVVTDGLDGRGIRFSFRVFRMH